MNRKQRGPLDLAARLTGDRLAAPLLAPIWQRAIASVVARGALAGPAYALLAAWIEQQGLTIENRGNGFALKGGSA